MDVSELETKLSKAWCKETSSDPEHWTADNPAWGQCVATALIVNDHLGGEIVCADAVMSEATLALHFFNNVSGREIDLTRRQFPQGTVIPAGAHEIEGLPRRDAIMAIPYLRQRYELLKERVEFSRHG